MTTQLEVAVFCCLPHGNGKQHSGFSTERKTRMSTYSAPDRSAELTTKPLAPVGVGRGHAGTDDWSSPAKFGRRHPTVDGVGKAAAPDRTATGQ